MMSPYLLTLFTVDSVAFLLIFTFLFGDVLTSLPIVVGGLALLLIGCLAHLKYSPGLLLENSCIAACLLILALLLRHLLALLLINSLAVLLGCLNALLGV